MIAMLLAILMVLRPTISCQSTNKTQPTALTGQCRHSEAGQSKLTSYRTVKGDRYYRHVSVD